MTDHSPSLKKQLLCKQKFQHLNQLSAEVHKVVGHDRPVSSDDIVAADRSIKAYMKFYRRKFADRSVTPKQHILESHVSVWMQTWGFGMGFHGEQGGEQIHAIRKRMKQSLGHQKSCKETEIYLHVAPDLQQK